MPPKGWKKYPDGFKPVNSSGTPVKEKQNYKLDDLLLPKATIHKLASDALPTGTTIPQDGLLALRRSTAVFINYISAEANTVAQAAGRKTIQPPDVIKALEQVDLAQFLPSVRSQLEEYEEYVASRKRAKKNSELEEEDHLISDDEEKPSGESAAATTEEANDTSQKKQKVDDDSGDNEKAEKENEVEMQDADDNDNNNDDSEQPKETEEEPAPEPEPEPEVRTSRRRSGRK